MSEELETKLAELEEDKPKKRVERNWWLEAGKVKRNGIYEELLMMCADKKYQLKQIQEHFQKKGTYISIQTLFRYRKLAARKAEAPFALFLNITDKLSDVDEEMNIVKDRIQNIKKEIKDDRTNFEEIRNRAIMKIKQYVPSDQYEDVQAFIQLATSPDKIKLEQLLNDYLSSAIKIREFVTKYQFDKVLQLYTNFIFKFVFEQISDTFLEYVPAAAKSAIIEEFRNKIAKLANTRIGELIKTL